MNNLRLGKLNGSFCAVWTENGMRHRHRLHTSNGEEALKLLASFDPSRRIAPRLGGKGFIYFIQCDEGCKPVKIGYAKHVGSRLNGIRVGCPFPLHVLGVMEGNLSDEALLHEMFEPHLIVGEWFKPAEEILDFVRDMTRQYQPTPLPVDPDIIDQIRAQWSKVAPPPETVNTGNTKRDQTRTRL